VTATAATMTTTTTTAKKNKDFCVAVVLRANRKYTRSGLFFSFFFFSFFRPSFFSRKVATKSYSCEPEKKKNSLLATQK
jgi:hypothetical protein